MEDTVCMYFLGNDDGVVRGVWWVCVVRRRQMRDGKW
jgi:hypothetical protein